MRQIILALSIGVVLAATSVDRGWADDSRPAEVIVLSTLHQLHERTEGYSFQDLSAIIEQLHPDLLAVELTANDLASRRDQSTKQEYPRSVFPLLDKHHYGVVALEPSQPLYGELVGLFRTASQQLREENPAAAESFDVYADSLYQMLAERWVSPAEVNSQATDVLLESKHRFQSAIFGPVEARAWEGWNQHFLQQILTAANANPGARILVLVGAEHAYWLRARLDATDVVLRDTRRMLDDMTDRGSGPETRAGRPHAGYRPSDAISKSGIHFCK